MKKYLLCGCLVLMTLYVSAQTKYEREYRLKKKNVPATALEFVQQLGFTSKIKWYKEEGIDQKTTVEAKTKHKAQCYSIEFNAEGQIEDVEIKIAWEAIPKTTQTLIGEYFETKYDKIKIRKIQVQYTGVPSNLVEQAQSSTFLQKTTRNYEIVVKTKSANTHILKEYLFNDSGKVLSSAKIVFQNSDHLEY